MCRLIHRANLSCKCVKGNKIVEESRIMGHSGGRQSLHQISQVINESSKLSCSIGVYAQHY